MHVTTIGLDIAKNVIQLHGVDEAGQPVLRRKVRRDQLLAVLAALSRARSVSRRARRRITGRGSSKASAMR